MFDKKQTETSKLRNKIWHIEHQNKKFSNTTIEIKIADELRKKNIKFKQNIGIENIANVDFYLPDFNLIIFCDGCYYHNCLEHFPDKYKDRRIRDMSQTRLLKQKGFNVYRFWEHEINRSQEECINKIELIK